MRNIATGLVAAALIGLASTAAPAARNDAACATSAATAQLRMAACRHVQCNCRYECIRWEGGKCIQTYRTCDVCSICD
jgi:hypothetical protein